MTNTKLLLHWTVWPVGDKHQVTVTLNSATCWWQTSSYCYTHQCNLSVTNHVTVSCQWQTLCYCHSYWCDLLMTPMPPNPRRSSVLSFPCHLTTLFLSYIWLLLDLFFEAVFDIVVPGVIQTWFILYSWQGVKVDYLLETSPPPPPNLPAMESPGSRAML